MSLNDERYFADLGDWIVSIFNRLPLDHQPKYIADLACGDGNLLRGLYDVIRARSTRGERLQDYPLGLIAVEQDQQALAKAADNLAGIPDVTFGREIDTPDRLVAELKKHRIDARKDVLYLCSFLDRSRLFTLPSQFERPDHTDQHYPKSSVDRDRNQAHPTRIEQSFSQELRRWSEVIGDHGLIVLDVNGSSRSNEEGIEADAFLMAAAQAGLVPKSDFTRQYVMDPPFSHVTLHWLERRPYTIRHAELDDLPVLLRLEAECWPESLRATEEEIRHRIEGFPSGQCALVLDGRVGGVIYSQKITNAEALFATDFRSVAALHTEHGSIIQLLAANVLPEVQHLGLGDQLLEFMLQYCALKAGVARVVAVTLCKDYATHAHMPMEEYIHHRNEVGMLTDPILRFHEAHGAVIEKVVPAYRPPDVVNQGHGVLIAYDIHDRHRRYRGSGARAESQDLATVIQECILAVLGENRRLAFAPRTSLMDMGLDSLALLELRGRMSHRLRVELEPTFFFKYTNPEAITQYFQAAEAAGLSASAVVSPSTGDTPPPFELRDEASPGVVESPTTSVQSQAQDAIAIIGMACRFPGDVNSPEEYWSVLKNGVDGITEVPKTRWDLECYYDPERQAAGKVFTKYGGFLRGVDGFDAHFFRISPREAIYTDPQQRILLEETWKALEHAGIDPESLRGTQTGVFVGVFTHDYELLQVKQTQATDISTYFGTGNSLSVAAGRLAYFFGFSGPTLSVDTACSSSLVALHLACQSLRNGECNLALAAGVNLLLSPELSIAFSQAGMLSPDGRCKTFDKSADGYVRSEGCGVVVLKPLSQARADGDNILALVRGSAINQDGASNGLTAPNGLSQQAVIQKALAAAGTPPEAVSYVETHGTGTALGDPIEVNALKAVYGPGRASDNPLIIGSVKTQIGHAEAAAGIAGLIKVVLAIQHKYIPSHLHFTEWNPHIAPDGIPVVIPARGMVWNEQPQGSARIAGTSSFGFSGTNVHAILSEAPARIPTAVSDRRNRYLVTLSAKSESALRDMAHSYLDFLADHPQQSLADVCRTVHLGRSHFDHRLAAVTATCSELQEQLKAYVAGRGATGLVRGHVTAQRPRVAFLFTGQGAQYTGMGRRLYDTQPTFRRALARCDEILRPYLAESLVRILYPDTNKPSFINETRYTQPALFALEYSLAELWKSYGIEPGAVLGHSVGEYAAACVAGVFGLEDGLKLIAARGRLMQALPRDGEMLAVLATEPDVAAAIEPYANSVAIAAVNGPDSVVISGKREDVRRVGKNLESRGIRVAALNVSHAFHSPLMDPILEEFRRVASEVRFKLPALDVVSNVTGKLATADIATPDYWCRHIRQPVKFADGMATLHQAGYRTFLEIGPKPILLELGRRCLSELKGIWLPSLREGSEDWQQILLSLADLYVHGGNVSWAGFEKDHPGLRATLPTYAFQHERYWIKARELRTIPSLTSATQSRAHPLLGLKLQSPLKETVFESHLSPDAPTFLKDHCVYQRVVMPAAGFVEMALAAGAQTFNRAALVMHDIVMGQALALSDEEPRTVQLILTPDSSGSLFEIHSLETGREEPDRSAWKLHASGRIAACELDEFSQRLDLAQLRRDCAQERSVEDYYQHMRQYRGVQHGHSFQAITQLWQRNGAALGRIQLPSGLESESEKYQIHPVLLDAAFQVLMATFPEAAQSDVFLPVSVERLHVYRRPGLSLWSYAELQPVEGAGGEVVTSDLQMCDDSGHLIARFEGFACKRASRESVLRNLQTDRGEGLYEIAWQSRNREPVREPVLLEKPASWLIFVDKHGVGVELANMLEGQGDHCIQVFPARSYRSVAGRLYRLDPASPDDFRRMLSEIVTMHPPCRGVVHLWSLDETASDDPSAAALRNAQTLGCAAVLHLVQALVQVPWNELPRLWLVTRGTQSVRPSPTAVSLFQAPLWGLARVIDQEHPDLQCVRLDLDPSQPADEVDVLLEELRFPDKEDEIAFREGGRFGSRLVRRRHRDLSDRSPLNGRGSYLITGGFGGLGLQVARWMVEQGARSLVLTGRHDPSPQAQEVLNELGRVGARVLVAKADVSAHRDVAQLLDTVSATLPPLRGVIHAAGVMDEGDLLEQTWERFTRVMASKLDGAWNLHSLTLNLPLEFFVCFSSISSVLGSSGQGNYAAANAFMDALVHYRRALSLPGLSINWGPWAAAGMANRFAARTQRAMEAIGLEKIAPERGLRLLGELMGQRETAQLSVCSINWDKFIGQYPAGGTPSLLGQLVSTGGFHEPSRPSSASRLGLMQRLDLLAHRHEHSHLVTYLQELVANALGTDRSIDTNELLNHMGLDSLMALQLRNRIKNELAVDVPVVRFLAGLSVATLATLLQEQLSRLDCSSGSAVTKEAVAVAAGGRGIQQPSHLPPTVQSRDWVEGEI